MLAEELLAVLVCPVCGGAPLRLDVEETRGDVVARGSLGCADCKRWYRVTDDIPSLMPEQVASSLRAADEHWARWRAVMDEFLQWRDRAWGDPEAARARREAAAAMHSRFIEFCDLPARKFMCLDVGAGSGQVADLLPEECTYIGIDPLRGGRAPDTGELPEHMPRPSRAVSLVQGVGEVLPFADGSFDAVLIFGALDHCNEPDEVLAESRRVLAPGGRFGLLLGVAEERPPGGLLRSLAGMFSSEPRGRETHTFTFTAAQLDELVGRHFAIDATCEDSGRAFVRATADSDVSKQ